MSPWIRWLFRRAAPRPTRTLCTRVDDVIRCCVTNMPGQMPSLDEGAHQRHASLRASTCRPRPVRSAARGPGARARRGTSCTGTSPMPLWLTVWARRCRLARRRSLRGPDDAARVHLPGGANRGQRARAWRGRSGSPLVTSCDVRSDDDVARVFSEVSDTLEGSSTCSSTRSRSPPPRISRAASPTRRATVSGWRSTFRPTRSSPARAPPSPCGGRGRRLGRHDDLPRR